MCERVKTAVEMAQNKRQLGKGDIVVMFQQVALDLAKQGEKMVELEKRITSLEEKTDKGFASLSAQLDEIQKTLDSQKKPSFWERIPLLKEVPTVVWFILWTIVIAICCLFGLNPSFIQYMKGS